MNSVIIIEDLSPARIRFAQVIDRHPDLKLAGTAATLRDGIALLHRTHPDVVLLDLGLPDGSGVTLLNEINAQAYPTQALIISVYGDEHTVVPALEAGAAGYLLKDHPTEDIPEAIFQMIQGGAPISPVIARHMLRRFRPAESIETIRGSREAPADSHPPREPLTKREHEVLELVSRGYTSQEIAEQKGKSYHTITTHVRNIYRKLAVNSRAQAVSAAIHNGLLPHDSR